MYKSSLYLFVLCTLSDITCGFFLSYVTDHNIFVIGISHHSLLRIKYLKENRKGLTLKSQSHVALKEVWPSSQLTA